jgi:hypothetical protein
MPRFSWQSGTLSIRGEDRTQAEFEEAVEVLEEAMRVLKGKGWKADIHVFAMNHVDTVRSPKAQGRNGAPVPPQGAGQGAGREGASTPFPGGGAGQLAGSGQNSLPAGTEAAGATPATARPEAVSDDGGRSA